MFNDELPSLRNQINEAHQKGNSKLLLERIHKLHGSCCYTGAPRLKKISASLEDALKSDPTKNVSSQIEELNQEINAVLAVIQEHYHHEETS